MREELRSTLDPATLDTMAARLSWMEFFAYIAAYSEECPRVERATVIAGYENIEEMSEWRLLRPAIDFEVLESSGGDCAIVLDVKPTEIVFSVIEASWYEDGIRVTDYEVEGPALRHYRGLSPVGGAS